MPGSVSVLWDTWSCHKTQEEKLKFSSIILPSGAPRAKDSYLLTLTQDYEKLLRSEEDKDRNDEKYSRRQIHLYPLLSKATL